MTAATRPACSSAPASSSRSRGAGTALERLFRLFVLNCALRNGDAHLKNFGIIYDDVVGSCETGTGL